MNWLIKDKKGFSAITIIILLFVLLVLMLFILFFLNKNAANKKNRPSIPVSSISPSATPGFSGRIPVSVTPLQQTKISSSTDQDIQKLNIQNKKTLPDGRTEYELASVTPLRPNVIITKEGVAVFESERTPENPQASGYATISSFVSKYGQADETIQGSKFYGDLMNTYIYASQGFAFIGNPNTNEVFEIQIFAPMSAFDYTQQFGQDLNPHPQASSQGEGGQLQASLINFKSSLPYYGAGFSILYNRDADSTSVTIKQANKDTALAAFNAYLSKFGITDSSQINNLTIQYK